MNIISEVGFGVTLDNSFNLIQEGSFTWALKTVSNSIGLKLIVPRIFYSLPISKLKTLDKAYDIFINTLKRQLEAARSDATLKDRKNLISQLAAEAFKDNALPETEVLADTVMFYIAGHETTANALSFALRLIADHPSVQEKMLQEVNSIVREDQPLTYAEYPKLQYCRSAFQESLRLYPGTPVVFKSCLETVAKRYCGYGKSLGNTQRL